MCVYMDALYTILILCNFFCLIFFFPFSFPFHSRPAGLPSPFASSTPANSPLCAFDFHPIFIFSTRPRFPLPFSPLLLQHYLPCSLQFAFPLPTNLNHCFAFDFFFSEQSVTRQQHHLHHNTTSHYTPTYAIPHLVTPPPLLLTTYYPTHNKVKKQGVAHAFASISALAF